MLVALLMTLTGSVACTDDATVREVLALREDLRTVLGAVEDLPRQLATPTPQPIATPTPSPRPTTTPTSEPRPTRAELLEEPTVAALVDLPSRVQAYEQALDPWLATVRTAEAADEPLPDPSLLRARLDAMWQQADDLRAGAEPWGTDALSLLASFYDVIALHVRMLQFIEIRHNFSDAMQAAGAVWALDQENAIRAEIDSQTRELVVRVERFVQSLVESAVDT